MKNSIAKSIRKHQLSRRELIGGALASASVILGAPAFLRGQNLNSRLNIALIACGGRALANMNGDGPGDGRGGRIDPKAPPSGPATGISAENITVLCDVNQSAVDAAAHRFPKAKKYNDYRRVFDSPSDFDAVIEGCAEPQAGRQRTWINDRIRHLYGKLHDRRHCHSIEVYDGEILVGGLYGVTLGRVFFGESMFHRVRDASKVALVHLVARLRAGGFRLLDTQFVTDHLQTFGAVEVPRRQYHKLLEAALGGDGDFGALGLKHPVPGSIALAQLAPIER